MINGVAVAAVNQLMGSQWQLVPENMGVSIAIDCIELFCAVNRKHQNIMELNLIIKSVLLSYIIPKLYK